MHAPIHNVPTLTQRLVLNATSTASASAAAAAALAAAGNATLDPRQPKLVTGAVLRSYQVDGVQWLISLYENGLNGILADEMGLGKTLQVISFFAHLWEKKVKGPFLVVAPLSTVTNWVKEFERFAPDVPVLLYHGTKQERAAMRRRELRIVHGKWTKNKAGQALPVVVTSFEIALNDARMLAAVHWKYLTVDEVRA
jgi:ATP-dependent DNA helicase